MDNPNSRQARLTKGKIIKPGFAGLNHNPIPSVAFAGFEKKMSVVDVNHKTSY